MDGIEATKQIRLLPQYAQVPIVAVTAGNVLGEREKCLAAGMNDFLPKPLRQADLLEKLLQHVALHENEQPNKIVEHDQHLDLSLLNEQVGDDEEFRIMFLHLVLQELTLSQEKLKNAIRENDIDDLKKTLHKLKGTAGTAGLFKLAEISANSKNKNMLILIAEDDELILKTIEHKLLKEGYEVILSRNGREAIDNIQNKNADLIITDIMMPFASGIEILSAIKSTGKKTPVIMLSSMGQEEVVLNAFDLGASDFIVKPFSPNELMLRIKRLMSK